MTEIAVSPPQVHSPEAERAGFRLQRFEVYNWGTFDGRVWVLESKGDNSLLTGDIGSGKSTLVDALTTLLVPAQRITYNKAAGAESKERTLRSYVLGHYKSERADTGTARAVALRDHNSYSVILGHFFNEGYDRHITLAQVFWIKELQGQPPRFYVVADRPLTIAQDFADFGPDIADLRKRLRVQADIELHDTFPPYGAAFRRRFGIESEQALELFNQTVSMKSVGNLTDFVRAHMLEAFPVEARIEGLITHFDDLDRAHLAVLKAKAQITALEPLVTDAERHTALAVTLEELRSCREALRPWFAGLKGDLLQQRIARLDSDIERLSGQVARLTDQHRQLGDQRDDIKQAISKNGGDHLERLRSRIATLTERQEERRRRAEAYSALVQDLGFPDTTDETGFLANLRQADSALAQLEQDEAEAQNHLTEATVVLRGHSERQDSLQVELASLRQRRSNITATMLTLRQTLCSALGLSADTLPFVGELLQIRDTEGDWEGAIERLLHNYGLSLLVPDLHYRSVAEWVERTNLRGRLVYYRVLAVDGRDTTSELQPTSLVHKVAIRSESPFYGWLARDLSRRFDYSCCLTLEQFRRERKAITRTGQIKTDGERHEKDDRHALDDRARYILGWSNEAKIAALAKQASDLQRQIHAGQQRLNDIQTTHKQLREREGRLKQLTVYRQYNELDWQALTLDIQRLDDERRALEAASDVLRTLQAQLVTVDEQLGALQQELDAASASRTVATTRRGDAEKALADVHTLLAATPDDAKVRYFPQLESMRAEALSDQKLTVESCDNRQSDMREWLQKRIDAEDKKLARLRDSIIDAMRSYKLAWPIDTSEVDVAIEATQAYREMLDRLRADDLPRFEAQFKTLLNQNTIREVAGFQAQLNREREEIRERITTINRSLRGIDYNPNRYISLQAEGTQDADIREFRESLRACTEGALTGSEDDHYSEAKFLQVKSIIERFRGREGQTDLDARWTRKVTDVRNWFVFSASERWREDDQEYEHYTDSGGKSGGQKEKLAYTVLAASLAYQFGLEWGEQRSRSFRFVVIDEAFGRGSDESTRYGLELFQRLNLQLLIVTPLQKIHVIEPFVANVGFVHNEDGQHSRLRNLTIEEYRSEQAARKMISVV